MPGKNEVPATMNEIVIRMEPRGDERVHERVAGMG